MFLKMLYDGLSLGVLILKKIQKQRMFFGSSFSFLMVLPLLFLVANVYGAALPTTHQNITNTTTYDSWSNTVTINVGSQGGNGAWLNVSGGAANLTINGTNGTLLARNNTASQGGVLYFGNGAKGIITISSMSMISNTATGNYGGAIYIAGGGTSVTFKGNYAYFGSNKSDAGGGAIYIGDANSGSYAQAIFSITSMSFVNNGKTSSRDGGSLAVRSYGRAIINSKYVYIADGYSVVGAIMTGVDGGEIIFNGTDVTVYNNYATGKGGALYLSGAGKMTFNGGTLNFVKNKTDGTDAAGVGGGAAFLGSYNTELKFSGNIIYFTTNTSLTFGGAIGTVGVSAGQSAIINFIDSEIHFVGNRAPQGATIGLGSYGQLYFTRGSVEFIDNISSDVNSQGNINLGSNAKLQLSGINSMVARVNKAGEGGFLYLLRERFDFAGTYLEMDGNEATKSGGKGGSFLLDGATVTFAGTTMLFKGNKAAYGAVLFATNRASVTFTGNDVTFERNETTQGSGVISWNNNAQVGFTGLSSLIARWNKAVGGGFLNIDGANYTLGSQVIRISSNSAGSGSGGGIYLNNSAVTFSGNILEISTNIAGTNGGGMYLTGSQAEFKISSMTYTTNTASAGGGMYFTSKSTAIFTSYSMKFNVNRSTNGSGGAIYYTASRANFSPTIMSFSGNVAQVSGGGMYFINSTANFINASTMVFERNIANTQVGGAMSFELSSATFAAKEMSFIGNQAKAGGAMFFSSANAQFINADRMSFNMNYSSGIGGAMYFNKARATFSPTTMTFSDNKANGSGGGMYFVGSTASFVDASTMIFRANKAGATGGAGSGGAMYFANSSATFAAREVMRFANNQAYTNGGAMYFTVANAIFSQAKAMSFEVNYATGSGGAMYFDRARANFSPTSMTFSDNKANGSGGGMYFVGSTASFVDASTMIFRGNKAGATGGAGSGGAMYFANSSATFAASQVMRFVGNQAYTEGGGMYFTVANAIFSQAKAMSFEVNYATGSGGAMYFDKARAIFSPTSMTFSDNKANGSGGGMYFVGSTASFVEASTMIFRGNKAGATGLEGRGGAMYFINSSATFAASQVMRFVGNQAYTDGGGMYFNYANAIFSQAKAMSFEVNYATGSGGAMYFDRARANFSPTSMTFLDNGAGISGGGMYFVASTATFAGSTMAFIGNKTNTEKGGAMYFVNSSATFAASEVMRFANNQAKTDGGGMYFTLSNALFSQSKEMKFEVNLASGSGGGLAFNNATVLFSPTSMTFSGNVAGMGGGIYLDGKSSATFSATAQMIFEANRAANGGGMSLANARALFDTRGTMIFRANVATSSGAGMYLSGSTMTFQAETMEFLENKADYGAVLYVTQGSKVIFTKGAVRFEHNETFSGNGVIAWDNGADVSFIGLKDLVSRYNKAKQGGFLYVEKASYELGAEKIEISSNEAVGGVGGAIYLKGSELVFNVDSGRGRLDITTNTAKTNGGGLYLEAALGQEGIMSSNLEFKAGTISFSKNVAKSSGGAIYLRESTITFAAGKMEFKGNEAKVGAVLYATSNSWVVFERGAVDIRNNRSEGGRGVISWDEGSQVSFRDLQSLQAKENSSPEGGFLYIDGADYKLGANEIEISSNEARTGSGGAVYLIKSTMSFEATAGAAVQIKFLGNRSSQEGGAIYASQGSLITLDTGAGTQGQIIFSGNKANNIANDIYLSNSKIVLIAYEEGEGIRLMGGIKAVEGSTVSMEGAGTLYLSGVTEFEETEFRLGAGNKVIITNDGEFTYNNASKGIEIIGSTMVFEKATIEIRGNKEGGLIAKEGASIIFMKSRKDMIFAANQGTNAGVVIRAVGGSTVAFSNDNTLKIENNGDTQTDSSILYWDETSQINFNGARILGKNNKAQNGVYVKLIEQDWKVNGYQLEMTGGEAGENGGVIYAQRSTVTLNTNARYISFSNNIAGGELNDIYLEDSILRLEATNEEITMNSGIKTQGTFRLIKTGEGNATIGGIVNVEGAGGEWEIREGRMIVNATPRDNTSGAGLGGLRGAPILQTKEALVIIGSMTVYEDGIYSMIGKGIVVTSVTNELVIRGGIEIGVESGQGWDMEADRIYASTITIVEGSYLRLKLYGANTASDIIPIMYTQWGVNGVENLKPVYDEGFFYSFAYDDDIGTPKEIYVRLEVPLISLENLTHNQREVIRMLNELKELDAITYRLPITRRLALGEGIGALQGLDEMSGEFLANALSMGARENNKVARHAQTNSEQKDMWIEGNINGFEYNKEGNYDGAFEGNEKEIMAGIDVYRTKEGAIGIFIGYGFIDIRQGESSAKIGDTKVGIYGGSFGNNTSFVGSLSGGLQELEIERYVGIKEEKPKSNFNTYSIRFSGEIDYKFILDSQREFYVKPFAGLNGGAVFNERIEEANGKITDLIIESGNYMRLEGNFGIKIELSANKMRYNGRLYGEYLLVGNKSEYEIGIAKIPKYGRMNIWGVEGKQVLGGIGIGAEYEATRNIGIYANTDIKSSLNTFVYFVNGGIKYKFGKATTR